MKQERIKPAQAQRSIKVYTWDIDSKILHKEAKAAGWEAVCDRMFAEVVAVDPTFAPLITETGLDQQMWVHLATYITCTKDEWRAPRHWKLAVDRKGDVYSIRPDGKIGHLR